MKSIEETIAVLRGSTEKDEQKEACRFLMESEDPQATEALQYILLNEDSTVVEVVAEALSKSGDGEIWELFASMLDREDLWGFRHKAAAEALGYLEESRALDTLLKALSSTRWNIAKEAIIEAIGRLGNEKARAALEQCLKDDAYNVRCAAAIALGSVGGEESRIRLAGLLEEEDRWGALHLAAAGALVRIDGEAAISALSRLLLNEHLPGRLQDGLLEALLSLGASSVAALLSAMPFLSGVKLEAIVRTLEELEEADLAKTIVRLFQADEAAVASLERIGRQGDVRAMSVLSQKMDRLPDAVAGAENYVKGILRDGLERLGEAVWPGRERYVCRKDLARFEVRRGNEVDILVCRICGESVHALQFERIVAVLDHERKAPVVLDAERMFVSWFAFDSLFDFDEVEIVHATDEEVIRLCMLVGNSTDKYRRNELANIPCRVRPECDLIENTWRVLRKTFELG